MNSPSVQLNQLSELDVTVYILRQNLLSSVQSCFSFALSGLWSQLLFHLLLHQRPHQASCQISECLKLSNMIMAASSCAFQIITKPKIYSPGNCIGTTSWLVHHLSNYNATLCFFICIINRVMFNCREISLNKCIWLWFCICCSAVNYLN